MCVKPVGICDALICRHVRPAENASQYPTFMKDFGGVPLLTIDVPQFEMQPAVPGAEVPGAPVVDWLIVQKSGVMPHCPKMLH